MPLPTPQLKIPGAFAHACICENTKTVAADLIKRDADNTHIFFNDHEYHNHVIEMLLAAFSLGANEARLKEMFEKTSSYQRPKMAEKSGFKWDSPECLGHEDYYTSYLNFFLGEIEKKGAVPCIEEYIFKDKTAGMFHHFMVGFHHPIIHVGYGIEFGIPLMVAEGLAMTAVHKPVLKALYGSEPPKMKEGAQNNKHLTALELACAAKSDKRFDELIKWGAHAGKMAGDQAEGLILDVANKVPNVLHEYMDKFVVMEQLDGAQGLRARATELQVLGAALSAGVQPPNKKPHIDFYLMHILTSSLFLHTYIEHLKPAYGAALLRGKFLVDLTLYVSRNRPSVNLDQFKSYPKQTWDKIIDGALAHNDEHVAKAIRALKHAATYDKSISLDMYQAMAQMMLDGGEFAKPPGQASFMKWKFDEPIGFEKAWENVPGRDDNTKH